jgi:hypothetical protein
MIRFLLRLVVFLAVLMGVLEIVFRTVIPASLEPHTAYVPEFLVRKFEVTGPRTGLYTSGRLAQVRNHWQINNDGWNSKIDYLPKSQRSKPLITIVGDSYIEGFYCKYEENVGLILKKELGDSIDVYLFGYHGLVLSQLLPYARYIRKYYDPDLIIFLFNSRDLSGSFYQKGISSPNMTVRCEDGQFEEVAPFEPTRSLKNRLVESSAILRYLTLNCFMDIINLGQQDAGGDAKIKQKQRRGIRSEDDTLLYQDLADYIVKQVRDENPGKDILIFSDADRLKIYAKPDSLPPSIDGWKEVQAACEKYGVYSFDLTPIFFGDYQLNKHKFNFPENLHWNPYAHRLVGEALAKYIIKSRLFPKPIELRDPREATQVNNSKEQNEH